jgi:hypothetical protein
MLPCKVAIHHRVSGAMAMENAAGHAFEGMKSHVANAKKSACLDFSAFYMNLFCLLKAIWNVHMFLSSLYESAAMDISSGFSGRGEALHFS